MYNKQTMGKRDILGVRTLLKPLTQQIFIHTLNHFTIHTKTAVKITNFIKTPKNTYWLNTRLPEAYNTQFG